VFFRFCLLSFKRPMVNANGKAISRQHFILVTLQVLN